MLALTTNCINFLTIIIKVNFFHLFCRLSLCGRSLAVGNEAGNVLMLAFEDMPFPAYYQYDQLKKAIYSLVSNEREMAYKVKSLGFFGYVEHVRYQPKKRHRSCKNIPKETHLTDEN